ncbi:hypothetical protein B9L23_10960 [Parageobacillus galactosidasius]|uniref:Uncharacterized protein n=1 Tax=Parageobacillus galactosidasius TaxID=883812 RepID=A0A226QGQ3_9BACL|nr:hypothetical protein B9L23_10960 [Parageobacillus galactosidasius]
MNGEPLERNTVEWPLALSFIKPSANPMEEPKTEQSLSTIRICTSDLMKPPYTKRYIRRCERTRASPHSHQVKNLIFFQRQKHGILSNENHRWKGLFFDGKKDEGMDKNDSSTLLL